MLTFNLKREWFEKIKFGKKTHEYREVKPYWEKRLDKIISNSKVLNVYNKEYCAYDHLYCPLEETIICFKCGYPKEEEKDKILYATINYIFKNFDGNYSDLHINEPVYDIEFKLIESEENEN